MSAPPPDSDASPLTPAAAARSDAPPSQTCPGFSVVPAGEIGTFIAEVTCPCAFTANCAACVALP